MSQATPPPLPPESLDPPPPMAVAAAWPAYAPVARVSRPGAITAMGVASIAVASVSVLVSIYSGLSLFVFSVIAPAAGAMTAGPGGGPFGVAVAAGPTTAPVQVPAAGGAAASAVVVEAGGMDADARRAAAQALSDLEFLSADRLAQLDALLAKSGRDIFPLRDAPASPGAIAKLVQAHGTSLSGDPKVAGPHFFRTRGGRFELYDDRAVFYPTGGGDVVRVSTLTSTNPGLAPEQVQAVVKQAQAASGNALNPSQVIALENLLSTEGQQFVSPLTLPSAVRSATVGGDASVVIQFPNGFATFGPLGQSTSASGPNAIAPAPGRVRLNGAAMALTSFAVVASAGLAVYLFVIGITTLRRWPGARRAHLIYAVLEIPVAILGAAAAWWLTASFAEASMTNMGPGGPMAGSFADGIGLQAVVLGVLGLIYPVVLLIGLQAKSVKDYYDTGAMG
jgi:hypothetical protein